MPDTIIARSVESRAEVESLDALHAERRALLADFARLRALHGPFGAFDAKRKAMLSAVAVRVRMELQAKGEKTTEAFIDAAAHADEQYQRFLDESVREKVAFIEADTRMNEIEERIRSRETELNCYRAELGLR
jgi:hypothetical protein